MRKKAPRNTPLDDQTSLTSQLLTTKLAPPRLLPPFVSRRDLLARLDSGLDQKLTLISAPAGFGKTSLVSEWIAGRRHQTTPTPIAWVTLDEGDNDPIRFWRYILTASQAFKPSTGKSPLALIQNSPDPPIEVLLTLFINEIAQLPERVVLVLEDYHTIHAPPVHESLAFLIDHLPATLHVILMTRSDPPLPLARLRARNELNELRAADLRFSLEETLTFLQQTLPVQLPIEIINQLADRTEGWAAGLRLVALASRGKDDPVQVKHFLQTFAGSLRPVQEYLVADVFRAQPEAIQEFLLQTSILSRLTGPLCDAITGRDDSALILEQLERLNLFLIPLDGAGHWYRFHTLFAEATQHYAQSRLGKDRLRQLALKASQWYEEHGMLPEAIEGRLAAQDFHHAASLIRRAIAPSLSQNEHQTIRRWMEQFPEEVLRAHADLCLPFATAILFTSNRRSPETRRRLQIPLQIAEEHWRGEKNDHRLGEVLAFHSLVGWLQRDFKGSFTFARQALERLPDGDRQWRGISLIMLGVDELMQGKVQAARVTLNEALALCDAAQNIYGSLDSMLLLGEICYLQGELHQAAQTFHQVLSGAEAALMERNQAAIRKGRAQLGLGMVALEWNDLEKAERAVSQAIAASQQFPEEDLLADSPVVLAGIKLAGGEVDQAQHILESLIAQAERPYLFRVPRIYQARLALVSGDLSAAERWAATDALPGDEIPLIQLEQAALVVARLRILQGEAAAAIQVLEGWLAEAQDRGRTRSEIEIQILLSQAHAALEHRSQAVQALTRALELAQPEGFQRIFLIEGDRLATILREFLPEIQPEPLAAYARALLYTMVQEQAQKVAGLPHDTKLVMEPLSDQEQRVLRLLAGGLSNPEIAEKLFVSVNTVKTHVKNIYAKLNVKSRDEARQAARHLKIY